MTTAATPTTAAAQQGTTTVSERAVRKIAERHAVARTRELTGLEVPTARVDVVALAAPGYSRPPIPPAEESAGRRTTTRRWSGRRVPVALLTSLATVACGALALDLIRPGAPAIVVVAGGLTALLGVWMVVLAVTPGLRRRSTVRTGADRVDATVDRSAVRSLIRDTVADVNGITTVRVRVRPQAATAVTTAARDAVISCRLRKDPRVRVTVTPEQVWQRPAPVPDAPSTTPAAKEVDQ